jgi:hypothetical protein
MTIGKLVRYHEEGENKSVALQALMNLGHEEG